MNLRDSEVSVGLLFPDLLGTYGDSGNAVILAQRLRWRGQPARVVTVRAGQAVPETCEVYVVGGGEDLPQALAARQLGAGSDGGPLRRAVDAGAVVLAVCAGLQIVGREFVGPDGKPEAGIGLLDCRTARGRGRRAVGEIVVEADERLRLPHLTGYENHAGATSVGSGASPLGQVRVGSGNGEGSGVDGAWAGRVIGTYLHGPVLARNPALADLLLEWAVGPLDPIDDSECDDLRRERLSSAGSGGGGRSDRRLGLRRLRH